MKIIFDGGIEVECTVEEFKELYNSGYFNSKQKSVIDEDPELDELIKQLPKIQPGLDPYKPDPYRDNVVMMYGCQMPNDSIRWSTGSTPLAGTSSNSLTKEQLDSLNNIVGNNTDEPKT